MTAPRWMRSGLVLALCVPQAGMAAAGEPERATPPAAQAAKPFAIDGPRWIELERAKQPDGVQLSTNIPTVKQGVWLFGGSSLFIDQPELAPGGAYQVAVGIELPKAQTVSIWVAGTPPGGKGQTDGRWVSPMELLIDGQPASGGSTAVSAWYAQGGNAWYRAANASLPAGAHELTLRVDHPRQRDGHYAAEFDALLVMPEGWTPSLAEMVSWSDEQWMMYLATTGRGTELSLDTLRERVNEARKSSKSAEAHLALAKYLQQEDLLEAARLAYQAAVSIDPNNRPALEALAKLAADRADWPEAIERYGALVSMSPEDRTLQQRYAESLEAADQLDAAATIYEQLLSGAPEDQPLLAKLAELARSRTRVAEAVGYDLRRRALGGLDHAQTMMLADDLASLDRAAEALAIYKSLDPAAHEDVMAALRALVASLHDPKRQAEEYRQLMVLRPDDDALRMQLAQALEDAGLITDAVTEYRTLVAHRPGDAELLKRLASRQRWAHDLDGAIESYRLALLIEPEDEATYRALLDTLIAANRLGEASDEARQLVHAHPTDRTLHLTLARLLSWSNRFRDALNEYEQALLLGPRDATISLEMARIYEATDHDREALTQYRLVLEMDPSNREAAERIRLLTARAATEGPGLSYSYFEDSRHIARWIAKGLVMWKVANDPVGIEYGYVTLHDRQRWVNGQWVRGKWEHNFSPETWVGTSQGVGTYDHGHTSYQYQLYLGHKMNERWELMVEQNRDDVLETPRASERGISHNDLRTTSTEQWTDRLQHVQSIGYNWYTDDNRALNLLQEWSYRVLNEPLVTLGGGYAFDDYRFTEQEEAYYSPSAIHTGFVRAALLARPTPQFEYGGQYSFAVDDSKGLSHGLEGHWSLLLQKDLWWEVNGRYFFDSSRFEGDRYFERQIGSKLSWRF